MAHIAATTSGRLARVLSVCKRRRFMQQSSELYGGLKGCYDYGPLGTELKRNVAREWWNSVVAVRGDVYGLDTGTLMPAPVWQSSGHLTGFSDSLVDCRLSAARFRADHAPPLAVDSKTSSITISAPSTALADEWGRRIKTALAPGAKVSVHGKSVSMRVVAQDESQLLLESTSGEPIAIPYRGYAVPAINSPFVGDERSFNLMFRTAFDGNAQCDAIIDAVLASGADDKTSALANAQKALMHASVYLRPETAQGTFVQFPACVEALRPELPFGLAQIGKSFRNEISVEHFTFRSVEFEQMELEYFTSAPDADVCYRDWVHDRMVWWRKYANVPEDFTLRHVPNDDLAHYALACTDIEYAFPWGMGEVEGIAHRGTYDLDVHEKGVTSTTGHSVPFTCPTTGGERPHVIEPAAGLSRAVLAFIFDAYSEETRTSATGQAVTRVVLKLHPRLAPIKAAVLPLVKKNSALMDKAQQLYSDLLTDGYCVAFDATGAVGRRYAKHDEAGTPFCITVDESTLSDGTVTVRERDTTAQQRMALTDVRQFMRTNLGIVRL